ncbi:hypothetical protein BDA99DRAFT_536920 [Phascolomyces articulosus]|uniref:Uncharacterized protein n=1 Tax=Phascolomyces articulosus TaxID=60185 RepID=A0AAD5KEL5_9FUNG|nr:hypothetical protein BDA99DRAFT_536920 [Phascolomyces articulosus]
MMPYLRTIYKWILIYSGLYIDCQSYQSRSNINVGLAYESYFMDAKHLFLWVMDIIGKKIIRTRPLLEELQFQDNLSKTMKFSNYPDVQELVHRFILGVVSIKYIETLKFNNRMSRIICKCKNDEQVDYPKNATTMSTSFISDNHTVAINEEISYSSKI